MINPFFDPKERRIRSFWRIAAAYALYMLLSGLLTYIVMIGVSAAAGAPVDFSNPGWAQSAAQQVRNSPAARVLAISSGVLATIAALLHADNPNATWISTIRSTRSGQNCDAALGLERLPGASVRRSIQAYSAR